MQRRSRRHREQQTVGSFGAGIQLIGPIPDYKKRRVGWVGELRLGQRPHLVQTAHYHPSSGRAAHGGATPAAMAWLNQSAAHTLWQPGVNVRHMCIVYSAARHCGTAHKPQQEKGRFLGSQAVSVSSTHACPLTCQGGPLPRCLCLRCRLSAEAVASAQQQHPAPAAACAGKRHQQCQAAAQPVTTQEQHSRRGTQLQHRLLHCWSRPWVQQRSPGQAQAACRPLLVHSVTD